MPRQSPRKRTTAAVPKTETKTKAEAPAPTKRAVSKRKAVAEDDDDDDDEGGGGDDDLKDDEGEADAAGQSRVKKKAAPAAAPAKKRKTAAGGKVKPEDMKPLAPRTAVESLQKAMYIGAHVSSAGGVQNSVHNAVHIGANAFALFLKSQRKWVSPPLAEEAISGFQELSRKHHIEAHKHCVPHGSYLVNLAAAEKAKADQAYGAFLDDLQRCEQLGIRLYNFHPGNTNGEPRAEALGRIAAQLNKAHAATESVVTLLENMAGQGNVVGSAWEDLRDIIAQVDDKSRVGVCIDTCHAFAAGHDLRSADAFAATMAAFDDVVGVRYLRALHLNDSKAPLASHRDLHANIGTGFLGLRAFHHVMNDARLAGLPMVLETPIDRKGPDGKAFEDKQVWADEIKLLERLVGMDAGGDEFAALEAELQARGDGERSRIQDQVDRKAQKDTKKKAPAKGRAKKATATRKRKRGEEASDSDDDGSESD